MTGGLLSNAFILVHPFSTLHQLIPQLSNCLSEFVEVPPAWAPTFCFNYDYINLSSFFSANIVVDGGHPVFKFDFSHLVWHARLAKLGEKNRID